MPTIRENLRFWFSPIGMLTIPAFFISLLVVIMTSASKYTYTFIINGYELPTHQMAFVNFVGSFCCITLLISATIYILGLFRLPLLNRLPWRMMEIVYAAGCGSLYFIAMAVAGHSSNNSQVDPRFTENTNLHALFAAIAVFCAFAMIVFGVKVFLILRSDSFHQETSNSGKSRETDVEI